jgi:hypothetical protein
MIGVAKYTRYSKYFIYSCVGFCQTYPINRMKTLWVITLCGFHCRLKFLMKYTAKITTDHITTAVGAA